ncbi:MAG: tRNA uridine-5-carboxymethylaminomethyl(34) synthesis GTPase MnmE [Candidatus Eremiobacteraeota bacterium]|nr:tRNA uridine-5-carboxymethylaminomethyl(34) synthesis GTPase MnmE [Candidatus Eremiobacteraeota bacterium]
MRASGPDAAALASRLFQRKAPLAAREAAYGNIVDERGTLIDRGLALLALAPHSYTGEDTIEFHVHGSPVVAAEVLRALLACGARYAQPGEFTQRAFLHGKMDLHAAASVADLIDAEHRSAARAALANMGGALANEVRSLRSRLAVLLEELAASIDYPDEVPEPDRDAMRAQLQPIIASLERLLHDGEIGALMRDGVHVTIVGPPNAGKSSLLNALLGQERALVSHLAGTTRDTIEESIVIDGLRVRLTDTAGLRHGADELEAAGIERTHRALAGSRVVVVVLDGSRSLDAGAEDILEQTSSRERIVFFNKSDLGDAGFRAAQIAGSIHGTVRDHDTLERIRQAIAHRALGGDVPDLQRPHLASLRETDAVARALQSLHEAAQTITDGMPTDLIAPDLQEALAQLGQLTGESVTEELLTGIFSRFCIGK